MGTKREPIAFHILLKVSLQTCFQITIIQLIFENRKAYSSHLARIIGTGEKNVYSFTKLQIRSVLEDYKTTNHKQPARATYWGVNQPNISPEHI